MASSEKRRWTGSDWVAFFALLIFIGGAIALIGAFALRLSGQIADSGKYGDYMGGFAGTLFSAGAFLLIYSSLQTQQRALETQRQELMLQREEQRETRKVLEQQGAQLKAQSDIQRTQAVLEHCNKLIEASRTALSRFSFRAHQAADPIWGSEAVNASWDYFVKQFGNGLTKYGGTSLKSFEDAQQNFWKHAEFSDWALSIHQISTSILELTEPDEPLRLMTIDLLRSYLGLTEQRLLLVVDTPDNSSLRVFKPKGFLNREIALQSIHPARIRLALESVIRSNPPPDSASSGTDKQDSNGPPAGDA